MTEPKSSAAQTSNQVNALDPHFPEAAPNPIKEIIEGSDGRLVLEALTNDASDGDDIEVSNLNNWPYLPDGEYRATFIKQDVVTLKMFRGATRLFAHFKIIDPGPHFGKRIYGAWSVSAKLTHNKTRLAVKSNSDLYLMLCNVMGYRVRPDRVSFKRLRGCILQIKTRTVRKNFRQREYPSFMKYSVVSDIMRIEAGGV